MLKKISALIFSFFLLFPVAAFAADELIIGGDSIGIEVNYDGVMITGTYTLHTNDSLYDPATDFKKGDIITAVNSVPITSLDGLYKEVNRFQQPQNDIPVTVIRNNQTIESTLKTIFDESTNSYKSGLYVKDKIVGVGTLTYYDPSNQTYGALGHEIMDTDLKEIADVDDGNVYNAKVTSISKAQEQIAGEKHAEIDFSNTIGDIQKNTNIGIYGHLNQMNGQMKLPWAKKEEVVVGPAEIYTVLQGNEIEKFAIEITALHDQSTKSVKGIEFKVTDPVLLQRTNGVIQGMSGSPIIQNGKIVGAITHVITSDPIQGYGVYIEWMLEESSSLS